MRQALKKITAPSLIMLLFASISGCEKVADSTTPWVGVYNGAGTDSIYQVVISRVDNSTINIQYTARDYGYVYNFGELQNVMVASPTNVTFNENDSLFPNGGDYYNITGMGTLNGNNIALYDTGVNTASLFPLIIFSFNGTK